MPKHSLSIGVAAVVAALVLPAQANAEHENRYFGFGYQPFYNPPPVYYPPPPRVRESAPGIYEYEVAPGRWVRIRPGHSYDPRRERFRTLPQPQEAWRPPGPPSVPQTRPDETAEPDVAVQSPPAATAPDQSPAQEPVQSAPAATAPVQSAAQAPASAPNGISCEAAVDIVESFGFSDVRSTSCSGEVYGFDAARDGNAYSIKLSAADGELTEVRRR